MAAYKESRLEHGMITCEPCAVAPTTASKSARCKKPKRGKRAGCIGPCPLPGELARFAKQASPTADDPVLLHLAECETCRAALGRILVEPIGEEELCEAKAQLELDVPHPERCPAIDELANYAVWPEQDPIAPCELSEGRQAEIRAHLEEGCPACRKQVEITYRRSVAAEAQSDLKSLCSMAASVWEGSSARWSLLLIPALSSERMDWIPGLTRMFKSLDRIILGKGLDENRKIA